MAMTKCAECGRDISTLAPTCLGCGAPVQAAPAAAIRPAQDAPQQQPPDRRNPKIAIAIVVGLGLLVAAIAGMYSPDGGQPSGNASAGDGQPQASYAPVDAIELERAYQENTVAADDKFKGRRILVKGFAKDINTDIANDAYLVLSAQEFDFTAPQAHLASSERSTAAGLRRGQPVQLLCTGNGDIAKIPMLSNCTFSEPTPPEQTPRATAPAPTEDPRSWSEAEMSARFRCPETYASEDEQKAAIGQMLVWYGAHHDPVTVNGVVTFRMGLLVQHGCSQTLANIASNDQTAASSVPAGNGTLPDASVGDAASAPN
jgi:hypothetical protein